ncbi:uncharacterized protein LOC144381536 [Halichoerus grypus]
MPSPPPPGGRKTHNSEQLPKSRAPEILGVLSTHVSHKHSSYKAGQHSLCILILEDRSVTTLLRKERDAGKAYYATAAALTAAKASLKLGLRPARTGRQTWRGRSERQPGTTGGSAGCTVRGRRVGGRPHGQRGHDTAACGGTTAPPGADDGAASVDRGAAGAGSRRCRAPQPARRPAGSRGKSPAPQDRGGGVPLARTASRDAPLAAPGRAAPAPPGARPRPPGAQQSGAAPPAGRSLPTSPARLTPDGPRRRAASGGGSGPGPGGGRGGRAQGSARDKLPRPPRSPPLGRAAPPSRAPLPEPRPAAARGWARGAPGPRRPAETSSRPALAPGHTPPAPAPSPPGARSTPSGASSSVAPGPRAPGDRAPVAGAAAGPTGTGEPRAAAARAAAAPSSRGAHAEVPARRPKWDIRYIVGIPRASRDPASRVTLGRIPARAGRLRPWLLGGRPAPPRRRFLPPGRGRQRPPPPARGLPADSCGPFCHFVTHPQLQYCRFDCTGIKVGNSVVKATVFLSVSHQPWRRKSFLCKEELGLRDGYFNC